MLASVAQFRQERVDLLEPFGQDRGPAEHALHLAHGVVAGGLAAERLVLLGAGDDLRVESGELLHEAEVFVAEGIRAGRVVDVEDAEHLARMDQRDT